MKKVSVVIPVYNCREIKKALESVIKYKSPELELIVIDSESTDGTIDVIKEYENQIDVFVSEKDKGIYDGFNKGIKRASADWIIVLAADDVLLVNPVRIIDKYADNKTEMICGSIYEEVVEGECMIRKSNSDLSKLDYSTTICHPATFFKKNIYEKFGYYDISYRCAADRELFLRMRENNVSIKIIDEVIVLFSYGGISTNNSIKYAYKEDAIISKKYGKNAVLVMLHYYVRSVDFLLGRYLPLGIKNPIKKLIGRNTVTINKKDVLQSQE